MKLDPTHLEMLAAVVGAGSVSRGASALMKSQPSVSRSLRTLERRVGAPLFVSGRRPLQPTALGAALAAEGEAIAGAGQRASATLEQHRQGRAGVVRIGGTPFFMDGVVAAMTAAFQRAHPGVRIDQEYAYAEELARHLVNGALDLAICPMRADTIPEGLAFERLLKGRNVIACRSDHPLAQRRDPAAADMAHYAFIAPPAGSPLRRDLYAICAELGLGAPQIAASGGSLTAVLNMLDASDALTVLPVSVVFAMRRQMRLGIVPVRIHHPERDLGILTAVDRPLPPAAARMARALSTAVADLAAAIANTEPTPRNGSC